MTGIDDLLADMEERAAEANRHVAAESFPLRQVTPDGRAFHVADHLPDVRFAPGNSWSDRGAFPPAGIRTDQERCTLPAG